MAQADIRLADAQHRWLGRLRRVQDPLPQQVKVRSTIHLPLQTLEFIHLALRLPIAVRQQQGGSHGIEVAQDACGQTASVQRYRSVWLASRQRGKAPSCRLVTMTRKSCARLLDGLVSLIPSAHLVKFHHLGELQVLWVTGKQPGRLVCRKGRRRGGAGLRLLTLPATPATLARCGGSRRRWFPLVDSLAPAVQPLTA